MSESDSLALILVVIVLDLKSHQNVCFLFGP